jgi:hypothetical protein
MIPNGRIGCNCPIMYSHYVDIALILKQYFSFRCMYSELFFDPGRGEALGFELDFVDTLFLRCEAT